MRVYLDNAATTPIKREVIQAMQPYLSEKFGNASSIHLFGREARSAIDQAREQVASFLNCKSSEIIFTSGGTESDNLAIGGVVNWFILKLLNGDIVKSAKQFSKSTTQPINRPHIITSAIEHHAVLETIRRLEKMNFIDVNYISPSSTGIVDVVKIKDTIRPETILVSVMYANNEVGTIQPIREIGKMIESINKLKQKSPPKADQPQADKIYFHTDAVQAVPYLNCDTKWLHVDMLTLSGHKIGAPKGVGALFVKKGTKISPLIFGGHHEYGKRAGTENVAGIVGLGKAISLIQNAKIKNQNLGKLRDYFIRQVLEKIPNTKLNGDQKNRLPNNVNFSFKGVEGESILILLDQEGIAASSGSACTSASLEPSHVLLAMGLSPFDAHGSIRFTLGEETTKEELDYTIKHLIKIIARLIRIAPKIEN